MTAPPCLTSRLDSCAEQHWATLATTFLAPFPELYSLKKVFVDLFVFISMGILPACLSVHCVSEEAQGQIPLNWSYKPLQALCKESPLERQPVPLLPVSPAHLFLVSFWLPPPLANRKTQTKHLTFLGPASLGKW